MKSQLEKLIDKWEVEQGSYLPNAKMFKLFIDDAKQSLKLEKEEQKLPVDLVIEIDNQLIEMINKCDQTSEGLRNDGFEVTSISSEAMAQAYRNVRDMINCSR